MQNSCLRLLYRVIFVKMQLLLHGRMDDRIMKNEDFAIICPSSEINFHMTAVRKILGPVYDYAEWRDNNVKHGQEPKLIWKTGDGEISRVVGVGQKPSGRHGQRL